LCLVWNLDIRLPNRQSADRLTVLFLAGSSLSATVSREPE